MTILIGNEIVNISATSLAAGIAIATFGQRGPAIATILMSLLILVFGEITPKTFAIRNSEAVAGIVVRPLDIFARLILPIRRSLKIITDSILLLFLGKKAPREPFITQEELRTIISISEKEGFIEASEREMIHTVFDFGTRSVSEIMIPRIDIVACDFKAPFTELIRIIKESRRTKIPIYEGSKDHIRGFVYSKELLLNQKQDWSRFIRQVLYVPETMKLGDLLVELQSRKLPMAVVIDEYGGTSGLVTIEDILEELVGEIQDEHDMEEPKAKWIDKDTLIVSGRLSLRELRSQSGIELESLSQETVGGFILELLGRLPLQGETVEYKNFVFVIEEMKRNRIKKVVIKLR